MLTLTSDSPPDRIAVSKSASMEGQPAMSAHTNGSNTAAHPSASGSGAAECNGNGVHAALQQHPDDRAASTVPAKRSPVTATLKTASYEAAAKSEKGAGSSDATSAAGETAAAAAAVSPFSAARATKQAEMPSGGVQGVGPAADSSSQPAASGVTSPQLFGKVVC